MKEVRVYFVVLPFQFHSLFIQLTNLLQKSGKERSGSFFLLKVENFFQQVTVIPFEGQETAKIMPVRVAESSIPAQVSGDYDFTAFFLVDYDPFI